MKKTRTILNWILGGLLCMYLAILIFPSVLFANKFSYKNFTVYYHASRMDTAQLKTVLNQAEALLFRTKLYNPDFTQSLFICNSFNEFTFFSLFSRKAFAVNYPLTQHIFLAESSVSEDRIFRNGKTNNTRSLSGVIAHETTHSLLENKLGTIKYKLLPLWKNEGYCDFVANESSFTSSSGLQSICTDKKYLGKPSFKYFKYRKITQFLFEDKGYTLDKFLNEELDFDEVTQQFKQKYCTR